MENRSIIVETTAIVMNIPFLTLNKKHFEYIKDLHLFNV